MVSTQHDSSSLRICLVITTFYPFIGGGETHALLLGSALCRSGCTVRVITRRTRKSLPRHDHIEGMDIRRVGPVRFRRWGKYLMLAPVLLALWKDRRNYDVIFVSGLRILGIAGVLASKWFKKPVVLRAASCGELSGAYIWDSPHRSAGSSSLQEKLALPFIRLRNALLLQANHFLAISSAIAEEYRAAGVAEDKLTVINNGTDTSVFCPADKKEKAALRSRLGLPDGFAFCYTGKLNKGKGLEFLLPVMHRLFADNPDARLVLVGSGGDQFLSTEAGLKQYVEQHGLSGQVIFTGYVHNTADYLRACDAFVFPSENESLSNAVIEACACGLPCLVSRVGGIPDTIRDDVNGRLLPPGEEEPWLHAMQELIARPDTAERWGSQARARALEHNSIHAVMLRHLDLFRHLPNHQP